jgi:hypothetical protein
MLIVVHCLAGRGKDLAAAALMQQFCKLSVGRIDLLNLADVHRKLVVGKIGDLILGHQEFLPSLESQTIGNLERSEAPSRCRDLRPIISEPFDPLSMRRIMVKRKM